MTEQLDKQTLTRLAWITELRRQGHRQCTGVYFRNDLACAMGLLGEVAGLKRNDWHFQEDADLIGAIAGLNADEVDVVIGLNDGIGGDRKHTFSEIADVVDGWFKP